MVSEDDMRSMIQEWLGESVGIEDLAKTYAIIISEAEKQLNFVSEKIYKGIVEDHKYDDMQGGIV